MRAVDSVALMLSEVEARARGYPFSASAAFSAKYVTIPLAPARLKHISDSMITRSPSIQPFLAAAMI